MSNRPNAPASKQTFPKGVLSIAFDINRFDIRLDDITQIYHFIHFTPFSKFPFYELLSLPLKIKWLVPNQLLMSMFTKEDRLFLLDIHKRRKSSIKQVNMYQYQSMKELKDIGRKLCIFTSHSFVLSSKLLM